MIIITTLCSLNQLYLDLIFVLGFYAIYSSITNMAMK